MIVSFSGPWTSYLCFSEQEKTAARLGLGRFVVKQILQDSHHPARLPPVCRLGPVTLSLRHALGLPLEAS